MRLNRKTPAKRMRWWEAKAPAKPTHPKVRWVKRAGKWIAIATVALAAGQGANKIYNLPRFKAAREVQTIERYGAKEEMAFVRVNGNLVPFAEERGARKVKFGKLTGKETELIHTHPYIGPGKYERQRNSNPAPNDLLEFARAVQGELEKNPKPALQKCTVYAMNESEKAMGKIEVSLGKEAMNDPDNLDQIVTSMLLWDRALQESAPEAAKEIFPNYLKELGRLKKTGLEIDITPLNGYTYHDGYFDRK